ncbi:hypothetical protein GGQ80_003272 [Sphingomonas jinjuensis]|uniref:Uncharacterized protein n=1 Tax=Sphingomonas jinjuensis TaxID=535907 RepID=A0A840FF99_9SPHN|nr:hypothetical protein [Sphingomonas jinjuensis]MBB4155352.1 hypothetical protein [Sphingomonas jinjuensis]
MLFTTPTQFAALALALIAGWLLGLASHPGGRKWKERYAAERDAHAAARKDADARLAEARSTVDTRAGERDARIAELERENAELRRTASQGTDIHGARIAELERENAELRRDTPMTSRGVAPVSRARPAYPAGERRGWFDFNRN